MTRRRSSPDGFLDVGEAAAVLGYHPNALLRALRRGTFGRAAPRVYSRRAWRTLRKYYFDEGEVYALREHLDLLRS